MRLSLNCFERLTFGESSIRRKNAHHLFLFVAFITRSGGVVALKLSSFELRTHRLAALRPTFEPDERHRTNPASRRSSAIPGSTMKVIAAAAFRLYYPETTGTKSDLKDGVLLEAGFGTVAPNINKNISSWAYDYAATRIVLIDNRALAVPRYEGLHTYREAPDHFHQISQTARNRAFPRQFSPTLLRRLQTARPTGRASFYRHGGMYCSQAEAFSEG
ncbi:hypothetical protein [Agrobacterium tumefaciens]|uniref:hypothetical protein n=1 Tax=Agrobacterium tumefaciens TaxID=358 RepID=UPI001572E956|nr:hypothetical protein [Agrobacterium tumefaciens]WCK05593.1 hypothetical protein G6L31_023905 [Agrobacterium tumefaciens]